MEYTFRNGPKEKEIKLRLGETSIEISSDEPFRIPYEEITEVLLNHTGNLYLASITALNKEPLRLSNFSYQHDGERIDQSRAYMTFVRVLHIHLYGKEKTSFRTGSRRSKLVLYTVGFVGIAVLAFLSAYYFNQLRVVPVFIVGLLVIPSFLLLYKLRPSQWPKSYDPASLPMHLLPPAT
jgi:hypothetical protein